VVGRLGGWGKCRICSPPAGTSHVPCFFEFRSVAFLFLSHAVWGGGRALGWLETPKKTSSAPCFPLPGRFPFAFNLRGKKTILLGFWGGGFPNLNFANNKNDYHCLDWRSMKSPRFVVVLWGGPPLEVLVFSCYACRPHTAPFFFCL